MWNGHGREDDGEQLEAEHRPPSVRQRLAKRQGPDYLGDAVLGAIDGSVTTFATVAGAIGGGFSAVVVVVLGVAKLLADAFSMAASNYLSTQGRAKRVDQVRHREEEHVRRVPHGEREEIRQIFARKGFEGETLERIVETITADRQLWVETMVQEEHGLSTSQSHPLRSALVTFAAFIGVGLVPLLAFVIPGLALRQHFMVSAIVTGAAFIGIGVARSLVRDRPLFSTVAETVLSGGGASGLAYLVAWLLREVYGTV